MSALEKVGYAAMTLSLLANPVAAIIFLAWWRTQWCLRNPSDSAHGFKLIAATHKHLRGRCVSIFDDGEVAVWRAERGKIVYESYSRDFKDPGDGGGAVSPNPGGA
jgi:hypothetical protein